MQAKDSSIPRNDRPCGLPRYVMHIDYILYNGEYLQRTCKEPAKGLQNIYNQLIQKNGDPIRWDRRF
jgi:hypothetical protein